MKKPIITLILTACCGLASAQGTNTVSLTISAETLEQRVNNITNLQLQVSNAVAAVSNAQLNVSNAVENITQIASATAQIYFTNALVSAGFTNANFAEIDLSPYTGSNQVIALMRFQAVAASTVSVRVPGDTNTVDDTSMNSVAIAAGSSAYMICDTSTNGTVEVKATANTIMNMVAFIRRHVFE